MEKILNGWKEIEDFLGIKREAIIKCGYPVHKTAYRVQAKTSEIMDHLSSLPIVKEADSKTRQNSAD